MEGNPPPTDYAAILADMESKYSALGNAITSLRAVLATGALGFGLGDSLILKDSVSVALGTTQGSAPLPRGAFLGKTAPDAIKLYLSAMRKKQTNKEIAQALKEGGMESTGKNFDNFVTQGLFQLKNKGIVLRFDDGWGLAEWYPESFRTRVGEKAVATKRKKGKKRTRKVAKSTDAAPTPPKTKIVSATGLDQRVEAMLRAEPQRIFTLVEIATAVAVIPQAATLALARLARYHKAEKAQNGYRASSGNVQAMPKAV